MSSEAYQGLRSTLGTTAIGRPLHTVCAYNSEDDQAVVVTVYQPAPDRWEDYRRRK